MRWTTDLGDAFLSDEQDVMDAVQRERALAQRYGYLRSNEQVVVSGGPYISIAPVNPGFIVVPYYDPRVVYYAPRPGFAVGGAIRFGFGVSLGGFFSPWGWGGARFDWGRHDVFIANTRWGRTWGNRGAYVHPYEVRRVERDRVVVSRPVEEHRLERRSGDERRAEREGRPEPREEHGRERDRGRDRR